MSLSKIWIKNFRNIPEILLDLDKQVSDMYIYGNNNQGKSNFLLALCILGGLRAPSGIKIDELVKIGEESAYIAIQKEIGGGERVVKLYLKIQDSKLSLSTDQDLKLSKKEIKRIFPVFFLSADNLFEFSTSPSARRSLLDDFIISFDDRYQKNLADYQKIIKQKNHLLKNKADTVTLFNNQLVELGSEIVFQRIGYLKMLETKLQQILKVFFEKNELKLELNYTVKYLEKTYEYQEDFKKDFKQKLDELREREFILGYSMIGPHHDDWLINIDNKELIKEFSRGIQRSLVMLMYLARHQLLEESKIKPLILLDDALVEVDDNNKYRILEMFKNTFQVIYVTTEKKPIDLFEPESFYSMNKGILCKN